MIRRASYTALSLIVLLLLGSSGCERSSSNSPLTQRDPNPWGDEVVSIHYGTNAGFGQPYFPGNILGGPDTSASWFSPAYDPQQLLTLGRGGEIVLAFRDGGIYDSSGADFTVFSNPFEVHASGEFYRKCGIVSVSEDGLHWHEFPFDTTTFRGLCGATPTNGSANPLDPAVSGGDSFDLSDIGLNHAVFVKITDAADRVPDSGDSFNLDAVVAIHGG